LGGLRFTDPPYGAVLLSDLDLPAPRLFLHPSCPLFVVSA
jgi:hypothetical protein